MSLVEEIAKAAREANECYSMTCETCAKKSAQAALSVITRDLEKLARQVDTEYEAYIRAVMAHLDGESK